MDGLLKNLCFFLDRKYTKGTRGTKVSKRVLSVFSSPDPKDHVSYCHHLASVVRHKLFQKSSPMKLLNQLKPNLVWIITRVQNCVWWCCAPTNMATVTKNRTYGKIAGFWVITQKLLIISKIWQRVKMISTARSTYPAILK